MNSFQWQQCFWWARESGEESAAQENELCGDFEEDMDEPAANDDDCP